MLAFVVRTGVPEGPALHRYLQRSESRVDVRSVGVSPILTHRYDGTGYVTHVHLLAGCLVAWRTSLHQRFGLTDSGRSREAGEDKG